MKSGAVAHPGERFNGIEEVASSSLASSTNHLMLSTYILIRFFQLCSQPHNPSPSHHLSSSTSTMANLPLFTASKAEANAGTSSEGLSTLIP